MNGTGKAIFLSYASQDAEAAQRICEALRAAGLEVWFDRNELVGGDAWDQKIRKQIKECALFVPIISANTDARAEGYFRLEWKLAVDRSHLMADDQPFLFPIAVGDVNDATARVPDRFREVQWTRLRLDETPEELAARVMRLLGGAQQTEAGGGRPETGGEDKGDRKRRKRDDRPVWLRHAWSVVGLAFVAFALLGKFWREAASDEDRSAPAAAPATPEVRSVEAKQLVAKAWGLLNQSSMARAELAAADELCKRAAALEPTDAEVWATWASVHTWYVFHNLDSSETRRAAARDAANKAMRLAPSSFEARLAQALYWGRGESYLRLKAGGSFDPARSKDAIRLLEELNRERPDEPRVLFNLGYLLTRVQGSERERGLRLLEQVATHAGWGASAWNEIGWHYLNGRSDYRKAEIAADKSLAFEPYWNNLALKIRIVSEWHSDLEAMKTLMERMPVASLQEDWGAALVVRVHEWRREPKENLRFLEGMPNEWLSSNWYEGPKALLLANARRMAGQEDAAQREYLRALTAVETRLAATPNDELLLTLRAQILHRLGRLDEARRAHRALREIDPQPDAFVDLLFATPDERVAMVEAILRQDYNWPTPAWLRFDVVFEELRADPRFPDLVRLAESNPKRSLLAPQARDWPKNPELKRAILLIEGLEAIPDDLALAEQIVKPIVERAPTDVEAVTVMARVQSQFLRRGFDRSDERSAQARLYGERALQLDPNEPEAMLAVATYLFSRITDNARAERLLRRAMEVDPGNPRHGRMLADLLNVTPGREAEAIAQGQENVRRFPNDALTRYDLARHYKDQGRYEEFDRELDATLALTPLPNAMAWKARLQFGLRNDFVGMKRWLDQVPERVRGTERAVFGYFIYAAFGGDAETGLAALRAFPQKWFTDFEYAGPTALLNACLLERQGKTELARQQYEAALLEARRMKVTDPTRIWLNHAEFWPLLGLGRKEEAKLVFQRLAEGQRRPYSQSLVNGWWFTLIPGALLLGERDTALELLRESVATLPESRAAFRVRFQLDPRMAPFRDDAEIQAILAEPGVK